MGFLVTLFTNGTLITETVADRFAASPPARVEISLHGMTSATFDAITQASGSYDRCRHAIELLRARHIPLVLKTTALTINRDELLHIKRHAATLEGVSFKLGEEIRPALNGDGDAFRHALGQRELAELHAQDNDLSADAGRERAAATAPVEADCNASISTHMEPCSSAQATGAKGMTCGQARSTTDSIEPSQPSVAPGSPRAQLSSFNRLVFMADTRTVPTLQYREFSRAAHDRAAEHGRVIKAQLEVTYRCNLHCRHCYTDPHNNSAYFPRELSFEDILRLLDEMRVLGIVWLNLTGGDIFMHPRFFDIYEAAYRQGFLLQLYTNGTLFRAGSSNGFNRCLLHDRHLLPLSGRSLVRLVHAGAWFVSGLPARNRPAPRKRPALYFQDQGHDLERR
ncbi:MAG: radical SAM protein [Nitrospiraceae bacterium]